MENLYWRIRISVLWVFMAVGMSASMILFFMGSGVIEDIIAGEIEEMEITEGILLVFALFWLIPLIMAFLSLVLKDKANRWANIILGAFFAIFLPVDIAGHLSRGEAFGGHCLIGAAGIVVAVVIAWHGWKWPKLEE